MRRECILTNRLFSPLHIAIAHGHSTIMKLFLEIHAIGVLERRFGRIDRYVIDILMSPIDIAIGEGHLDAIKMIVEQTLSSFK